MNAEDYCIPDTVLGFAIQQVAKGSKEFTATDVWAYIKTFSNLTIPGSMMGLALQESERAGTIRRTGRDRVGEHPSAPRHAIWESLVYVPKNDAGTKAAIKKLREVAAWATNLADEMEST